MSESNKAAVSCAIEEIWNKGNFALADELLTADIVRCDPLLPGTIQGREAYIQEVTADRTAFPELTVTVDELIAQGDKVVLRWTTHSGIQKGELSLPGARFAPTGRVFTVTGISVLTVSNGKIREDLCWHDALSFWKQLGLVADPVVAQSNKDVAHRFVDEVINTGNLALIDELFTGDVVFRGANNLDFRGTAGVRQFVTEFRSAFPDIRLTIVGQMLAEGELTVARWTGTGTHRGEWLGIAPTGKQFTYGGTTTLRIVGGKIAEHWADWDALGLFQQFGVVTTVGQASAVASS
jgi:steroid delta-isomerase-like uncharacterized protein